MILPENAPDIDLVVCASVPQIHALAKMKSHVVPACL